MKKLTAVLMLILIMAAGCTSNQAYSEAEIDKIVDAALTRGELANLLYFGEFDTHFGPANLTAENGLEYDIIQQEADKLPLPYSGDIEVALQSFASVRDIKMYIQQTFVPALAEEYLAQMFTPEGDKYRFFDRNLMQCRGLATYPLSLVEWQHQLLEINLNSKDELQVMLRGRFILTGAEAELPLTFNLVDGRWLLDESFSPQEQPPEDYYYSQDELQNILSTTIAKAEKADRLYVADNFHALPKSYFEHNGVGYAMIDKANQDLDYADLAQSITTTAHVKRCFQDAFVADMAQKYIDVLFDRDNPLYIDTPQGLAYQWNVACMPIILSTWQPDDYAVWQNTQEQIIVMMGVDGSGYFGYSYYPLRLRLVDGKWLCDETYRNYYSNFSWDITE